MYLKPHFIHILDVHKIKKKHYSDIPTLELVCRCSLCCSVQCTSIDECSRGCLPTLLVFTCLPLKLLQVYSLFDSVATSTSLSSNKPGLIHSLDISLVLNSVDFNRYEISIDGTWRYWGCFLLYGGLVLTHLPLF